MKTRIKLLVILLAVIGLSNWAVAQSNIYVNAGETLRVKCWDEDGSGNKVSLDTDCDVNLSGDRWGNFADTIITTGPFYMEAGNESGDYLYYSWIDGDDEYTHLIYDQGGTNEWNVSKYNNATGYEYIGTFWVRFVDPTCDAVFTVTDASTSNPITGATVTITGESNQSTNSSGNCSFSGLADGTYSYSVTATGYDAVNSSFTVSGGNVAVDVQMTETTTPTYDVTFNVNASAKGIVGATVNLTGYGDAVTDGSGNCSFTGVPDGTYSYSVTADGYQDASGSVTVNGANVTKNVYMDPLGIGDVDGVEISVYPNPSTDHLTINYAQNVRWELYSITGQIVMSGERKQLDIGFLTNGYYVLKIKTDEGSIVKKILKR